MEFNFIEMLFCYFIGAYLLLLVGKIDSRIKKNGEPYQRYQIHFRPRFSTSRCPKESNK